SQPVNPWPFHLPPNSLPASSPRRSSIVQLSLPPKADASILDTHSLPVNNSNSSKSPFFSPIHSYETENLTISGCFPSVINKSLQRNEPCYPMHREYRGFKDYEPSLKQKME